MGTRAKTTPSEARVGGCGESQGTQLPLAERHARLEAQVASGLRDARSLVAIPAELARNSKVTWPKNAFGKPKPW